jgi:hypothetical protein
MKIPIGVADIMIGDKEIDPQRTMFEMELVEGSVVVQKLCPLSDLFLKSDSLTPSIVMPMVEYARTVSKSKLDINRSVELFVAFATILKKHEVNEEIYHCLMSLLITILYRKFSATPVGSIDYCEQETKSGIGTELTLKVKKIVEEREKDGKKMDEREEEIVFGYSWLEKDQEIEPSVVLSLLNIFMGILERGTKEGENGEAEMKAVFALQCVLEHCCLLFF